MNNYQAAKQASYKLIVKEARNKPDVVNLIPSFATGINRLEEITTGVDDINIQQEKDITGITDEKEFLKEELSDLVLDISGAIHSYATSHNDKILAAKVNYKETTISRMTQSDLTTTSGIILEEAGKIDSQYLTNEGISDAEMTEFRDTYSKFKEISSNPREAIIDRSGYTQQLADLFGEASELKKNTLDRLARQFIRKDPDFYQKYKAASVVIYKRNTKSTPTAETK